MKNLKKHFSLMLALTASACTYDFPESTGPTSGEADFSKTVVIGSSLSAGFMNGALYNEGQSNSFAKILTNQMSEVGGGAFNQPDINAVDGYYGTALNMAPLPDGTILGRLYLKGLTDPKPTPKIPGQAITPFAGDKDALNNFSAYGVSVLTVDIPQLGGPSGGNPYFNPYYARFASTPGTSTMLDDAVDANGTFFVFWLGNDDVLGYATNGADENDLTKPLTSEGAFTTAYNNAINAMLDGAAEPKGAVANIPDVTSLPHFSMIAYNPIGLDQDKANQINGLFASGYNTALDGLIANAGAFGISDILKAEITSRKLTFTAASNNAIVIMDETLTDLGPYFDALEDAEAISPAQRTGLIPYEQIRQTKSTDLIPLAAGSIIGTLVSGDATKINGITVPLADKYVLIPTEQMEVQDRIDAFNTTIANAVAAHSERLVLVDTNAILASLKENGAMINGANLTATVFPPFGGFSLDGIHPNARGNGYLANKFIDAINAKFGSNIPHANPNDYSGNALPVAN